MDEAFVAREIQEVPSREMPTPYIMSNSAWRNGGATLFFTTLAAYAAADHLVPLLIWLIRRTSRRTEA